MTHIDTKAVIRLIGGPANGFVFVVPGDRLPRLVGVGGAPLATYERETGDGEVICYRFMPSARVGHKDWLIFKR